jgi:hypothetical protein
MALRKVLPVLAVVVALVVPLLAQSAAAQPAVILACPASFSVDIAPGAMLLPSAQEITVTSKLGSDLSPASPCTSVTGNPPVTGGTLALVGSGTIGCLGGSARGTVTVAWNDGKVSTGTWSINLPIFLLPIVSTKITGGPFAMGAEPFALGIPTGFTGNCITSPLVHFGGIAAGATIKF